MNYLTAKERFNPYNDGTYNLRTGRPVHHRKGYQVSFERAHQTLTPETYNAIVGTLLMLLTEEPEIGVWQGDKELSFWVEDIKVALTIGYIWNQDAIWDWTKGRAINLRGE